MSDYNTWSREFTSAINTVLKSFYEGDIATAVTQEALNLIVAHTRSGMGVDAGGQERPLKPLSKPYVDRRQRLSLHSTTSPSTSNLTQTGEMLESLIIVKTTSGYTITGGNPNISARIANVSQERPFLNLSLNEIKVLNDLLAALIRDELTKAT